MAVLKHPRSGALYTVLDDGNVRVENNGVAGVFSALGQYLSGDIKQADPHLILWMAGPQLPTEAQVRMNR